MYFSRTTVLLVKAMKRITTFAFTFLLCALQMLAQIKTGNSRDDITINGIKFGYIYTYDQIKKSLRGTHTYRHLGSHRLWTRT